MKEVGTQVVIQIPAQKGVWEPIVDSAQDFCKKKDLYCGICIGWKKLWTFGKASTVFMTLATTTHPATAANKAHLAEVVKKVTVLATLVS